MTRLYTSTISRAAVLEILRSPKAFDTFPDMISRVEALEGAGVKVKPLVFATGLHPHWWSYKAESAFGNYYVDGEVWVAPGDDLLDPSKWRKGGFAAALADYEARSLSTLEPMEPRDE